MAGFEVDDFVKRFAPHDVRDVIVWLVANGYTLTSQSGKGTFGSQLVYTGHCKVVITVDRSQWMLEVAPTPGAPAWQYDLLVAAHSGRPYAEALPAVDAERLGAPLPEQLPQGVSWAETLPSILDWVQHTDASAAVDRARQERHKLMWPKERER